MIIGLPFNFSPNTFHYSRAIEIVRETLCYVFEIYNNIIMECKNEWKSNGRN
jgi:hypothetical protein